MSAGRIDHVAEAERFAAWADNPSLPPENVAAISSMAQVHATLALVLLTDEGGWVPVNEGPTPESMWKDVT